MKGFGCIENALKGFGCIEKEDVSIFSFIKLIFVCEITYACYAIRIIIFSLIVPPGYDPSAPPPQAYPPPTQAYPPQQPGYPPQQSYPPPGYPAQPAPQQQQNTNVVVVGGGAPAQQTTIIQQAPKEKVNHVLHLLLSCFIPGWIFVWMILCCIYGC